MTTLSSLDALTELLRRGCFDYVDEKICQEQIADYLSSHGVPFFREHALKNGIVDFFFPRSGIALEIKASNQWSKTQVYRQCERYCDNDEVTGLLLATGKAQGLPSEINQKPVRIYQLGMGQL